MSETADELSGPAIDAAVYAASERRLASLLDTDRDVLLLQGEAILLLEAAARGLGGPGVRALNVVTGPYGEALGEWLAVGGAEVEHLKGGFDRSIDVEELRAALDRRRFDVVSVVHAESATGVVNPLPEIAAAVHAANAVLLVDAVASVGAEPLPIDQCDLELVMIGPQKALGGPAGVCALVANERGWAQIGSNPVAPRRSILSLLDWREHWIDAGRHRVPGYIYEHEMRALVKALDALEGDVGLRQVIERHRRAAVAARAGAQALGLSLWVAHPQDAASVATLLRPPPGVEVAVLIDALEGSGAHLLAPAPGPLATSAFRINHTGPEARVDSVLSTLRALAGALRQVGFTPDLDAAVQAAKRAGSQALKESVAR